MKKNKLVFALMALLLLTGCIEDVVEVFDSLECANLLERISDDDNDNCTETIADINKIEESCGDFLTDEDRELFAFIRANCEDN